MLIFFQRARSYSSRNFLWSVAGSVGKSFEKPILSSEAAAKKSLYLLILSVLFSFPKKKNKKKNINLQPLKILYSTFLPNKLVPPPHWRVWHRPCYLNITCQTFYTAIHHTDNWQLGTPKKVNFSRNWCYFSENNMILRLTTIYFWH